MQDVIQEIRKTNGVTLSIFQRLQEKLATVSMTIKDALSAVLCRLISATAGDWQKDITEGA